MQAHTRPCWLPSQAQQHAALISWGESRVTAWRATRVSWGPWDQSPVRLMIPGIIPVPCKAPQDQGFLITQRSNSLSPVLSVLTT